MGKVVYVVSGKGGTGKSTFTANIGAVTAASGQKTLLIDMNPGMRTLDLLLGVQDQAIYHVMDVLEGVCTWRQAMIAVPDQRELYLLPGGMVGDLPEKALFDSLLDELRASFDVIVLDGAPGIHDLTAICAEVADETVLVTTPEQTSIRNADALEDYLLRHRVLHRCYVLNRVIPTAVENGWEPTVQEIDHMLRCKMIGMILEDENIRLAGDMGIPLSIKKDSYIAKNFRKIAERLLG